jgi:hypothetical protein
MVALGAVRSGVRLGSVHVFDYYRRALPMIVEEGLPSFLRRTSTPYLTRAGSHFDPRSSTYSERLLRRWADRRSPSTRQTKPQADAPDGASEGEETIRGLGQGTSSLPSRNRAAGQDRLNGREARTQGDGPEGGEANS